MSRILSKYQLPIPVLSACSDIRAFKQLNMKNGVNAVKVPKFDSKVLGADHLIKILLKTSKD